MTPTLETRTDLEREQLTARMVESFWDVSLVKMKKFYRFDYAAISGNKDDNKIQAFVELKCRKTPKNFYNSYMISEEKIRWAIQTMGYFKVPCFLVVAWSDAAGYYRIDPATSHHLFLSGRMDEHDQAESEPCCLIPVKYFTEIT